MTSRISFFRVFLVALSVVYASHGWSGFLEMPNTTEVPEYERESLLLDLDIPPLRDRDPNPEAGPRLNVKEFRVQGLVEYPRLGITREAIIAQVEKIRFDLMAEDKFLDSGYTLDEIAEVSDLVAEIEKTTQGRHVDTVEVQKLVFLIREQRRRRGITLGMIEKVADTITTYYRERGFILAKAYIPQQHVRDGVVIITLLLGELGEVETHNNKLYSDKLINRFFTPLLGQPVSNAGVEKHIYFLNDLPGYSATGYFEPGAQVGDTKLNINTTRERRFEANTRLDNHGSETTGEYRLYADININNPIGIGDKLNIGVLGSFNPENAVYGAARYSLPLYYPQTLFTLGYSSNDFVTDDSKSLGSGFQVTGESQVTDINFLYKFVRSRANNQNFSLGYAQINSTIDFGGVQNSAIEKQVNRLDIAYTFDVLNEKARVLHQGSLTYSYGDFVKGAEEGQEINPNIIGIDYSRLSFIKLPLMSSDSKLILRLMAQYAGSPLTEVLQFGLAGPTRSRGYNINEFFADDGAYLGADLVLPGPGFNDATLLGERLDRIFQPYLFVEAGYGITHPILEGEDQVEAELSDAGVGIKFAFKDKLRGNLSIAFPIHGRNSALDAIAEESDGSELIDTKPGDGAKLYFDIQYGF